MNETEYKYQIKQQNLNLLGALCGLVILVTGYYFLWKTIISFHAAAKVIFFGLFLLCFFWLVLNLIRFYFKRKHYCKQLKKSRLKTIDVEIASKFNHAPQFPE